MLAITGFGGFMSGKTVTDYQRAGNGRKRLEQSIGRLLEMRALLPSRRRRRKRTIQPR